MLTCLQADKAAADAGAASASAATVKVKVSAMLVAVLTVSVTLLTTLMLCINQHLAAVLLLCHLVPLHAFVEVAYVGDICSCSRVNNVSVAE